MHKSKSGNQILVLLLAAACGARCALAQHLTPFAPSGWSDKIYVANGPGTYSDSTPLSPGDTLYIGWAASFVLSVKDLRPAQVEDRIEQLALAYEAQKPYLISRWRWPDRFMP